MSAIEQQIALRCARRDGLRAQLDNVVYSIYRPLVIPALGDMRKYGQGRVLRGGFYPVDDIFSAILRAWPLARAHLRKDELSSVLRKMGEEGLISMTRDESDQGYFNLRTR